MSVVLSFFFWIPSRHQAPDGEAPQGEEGQVPVREGCQRQKYQDAQQALPAGAAHRHAQEQEEGGYAQQGRQPVQLRRQRRKMEDMGKVHGPR